MNLPKNPLKALALMSGGLDSILAIRMATAQGIEVTAVSFTGPFFARARDGKDSIAERAARQLGVELVTLPMDEEFLDLVRHPRHGWGREMNPCVDCRIFMLRRAARLMPVYGAELVITGEVLGQRPMSQHLQAMKLVERESGLSGRLLRPLSARLLEPTEAEKAGLVDRGRLGAIQGRTRAAQLDLARREGIDVFEPAGGGCLLTDPAVAARLRDLFAHEEKPTMADAALCACGKHFRLQEKLKVILGRNQEENECLVRLGPRFARAELCGPPGPTALLCGEATEDDGQNIARLLRAHAPKARGSVPMSITFPDGKRWIVESFEPAHPEQISAWRIEPGKATGRQSTKGGN